MNELIARLEAASTGSRELDYAIYRAVNDFASNWLPDFPPGGLPQFTRSLDAALTLVPAGMGWLMDRGVVQSGPLALCITALKARAGPAQGQTAREGTG